MKNIVPILTLLTSASAFVGCDAMLTKPTNEITNSVETFKQTINNYPENKLSANKKVLNKYIVDVSTGIENYENKKNDNSLKGKPELLNENQDEENLLNSTNAEINSGDTGNDSHQSNYTETSNEESQNLVQTDNLDTTTNNNQDASSDESDNISSDNQNQTQTIENNTLYNLTNDINENCDEFCQLKQQLNEAIIQTENMIESIQTKQIDLTKEQKQSIKAQANQLKTLSRQLTNITAELNFYLDDISSILSLESENFDELSMKYLLVLNNLINGNEMLSHGLDSLNYMNYIYNQNSQYLPPNNYGRMFYGFKQNGQPPIIHDYYIDENGRMIENTTDENQDESNDESVETKSDSSPFASNIDSYRNNFSNIDTFFNTALLDNEFMYGNRGYYPNMAFSNYNNYNQNMNYQNNENEPQPQTMPKRKRFQTNIDSYKTTSTPSVKTKLNNMRANVTNFFNKFNRNRHK